VRSRAYHAHLRAKAPRRLRSSLSLNALRIIIPILYRVCRALPPPLLPFPRAEGKAPLAEVRARCRAADERRAIGIAGGNNVAVIAVNKARPRRGTSPARNPHGSSLIVRIERRSRRRDTRDFCDNRLAAGLLRRVRVNVDALRFTSGGGFERSLRGLRICGSINLQRRAGIDEIYGC